MFESTTSDDEPLPEIAATALVAELRTIFPSIQWLAQAAGVTADMIMASEVPQVALETRQAVQQLGRRVYYLLLALKDCSPERRRGPLEHSIQNCVVILSDINLKLGSLSTMKPPFLTKYSPQVKREVNHCHRCVRSCALYARLSLHRLECDKLQASTPQKDEYETTMASLAALVNQNVPAPLSPELEYKWSMCIEDIPDSPPTLADDLSSDSSSIPASSDSSASYGDGSPSFPPPPPPQTKTDNANANHDSAKHARWVDVAAQRMGTVFEESAPSIDELKQPNMESPIGTRSNLIDIPRSSTVLGIPNEGATSHGHAHHLHDASTSRSLTDAEDAVNTFDPPDLTHQVFFPPGATPVAHGGYADIWEAELVRQTGREKVAIKVLRLRADTADHEDKIRKRLRREVRVWKQTKHRNILKLHGTCRNFGSYMAMVSPWFRNGTAINYIRSLGDDATALVRLKLLCGAADGLAYLHTQPKQIVHGDFTVGNILVTDDGEACLCDFGLSFILELAGPSSMTSAFCGSVRWMAPELVYSDPVVIRSASTDIYSFGAVAYQLLSDTIPFYDLKSDCQVIVQISRGKTLSYPPNNALRKEWWEYIRFCCSVDPSERPSMTAVAKKFHEFLADEVQRLNQLQQA